MTTATLTPTLTVTTQPTVADLQTWWEARQADPSCAIAFADNAPQHFTELCQRIATGAYLFYLVYVEGEVAGAMWVHDMQYQASGTPHTGWVGAYVLPAYRMTGVATAIWQEVRPRLTAQGIRHVFAAVHTANKRSQAYATRHMGLSLVDCFTQFTLFGGVFTDCLIYTLYPEDAAAAWHAAAVRAQHQRALASTSTSGRSCARCQPYSHLVI